jgi:hypothetical protein
VTDALRTRWEALRRGDDLQAVPPSPRSAQGVATPEDTDDDATRVLAAAYEAAAGDLARSLGDETGFAPARDLAHAPTSHDLPPIRPLAGQGGTVPHLHACGRSSAKRPAEQKNGPRGGD